MSENMREISFRGKSLDKSGAWVFGSLIHRTYFYGDPCDDYFILYGGEFDCDYYDADRVDPETVGQFTGLTDKNGKRIFEGDIVEVNHDAYPGARGEVFFRNGSFMLKKVSEVLSLYGFLLWCEVIGNIHDNPELLKENSNV